MIIRFADSQIEEDDIPDHCICDEDQGCGYTYRDEYGACPYCLREEQK